MQGKVSDRFNVYTEETAAPPAVFEDGSDFREKELEKSFIEKIEKIPVWTDYTEDEQKELIRVFVERKCKDCTLQEKEQFSEMLMAAGLQVARLFP
ncbi:MAG: hypothetical protein LBK53_06095 [Heliobacteriaceae bacterium]|nr:hypothetical protein [Heliobacteriaceae bacterium]